MADRVARRGFGVTVLLGLAAGVLAAVGGNRAWAAVSDGSDLAVSGSIGGVFAAVQDASAPLVTSLALVVLACWGVLLVTRGRFRRAISALGMVASVGLLAAAVGAFVAAPRQVRDAIAPNTFAVHHTVWSYAASAGAVVAVAAATVAVARVPGWPEMGRRYDAPVRSGAGGRGAVVADTPTPADTPADTGRSRGADEDAETTHLDLWRDIDQGRDPTDRP